MTKIESIELELFREVRAESRLVKSWTSEGRFPALFGEEKEREKGESKRQRKRGKYE